MLEEVAGGPQHVPDVHGPGCPPQRPRSARPHQREQKAAESIL